MVLISALTKRVIATFNALCPCKTNVSLENTNSLLELKKWGRERKKPRLKIIFWYLTLLWAPKLRCLRNLSVLSHGKSVPRTAFDWKVPDPRLDPHPSWNMSSSYCQTDNIVWFILFPLIYNPSLSHYGQLSENDGNCCFRTAFYFPDVVFTNELKNEERNKFWTQEPWTKMWIISYSKHSTHF